MVRRVRVGPPSEEPPSPKSQPVECLNWFGTKEVSQINQALVGDIVAISGTVAEAVSNVNKQIDSLGSDEKNKLDQSLGELRGRPTEGNITSMEIDESQPLIGMIDGLREAIHTGRGPSPLGG